MEETLFVMQMMIMIISPFGHKAVGDLSGGQDVSTSFFYAEALEQFDLALTTAPRQYMLCQAAYAGSFTSSRALSEGGGDGLQQWLWGRGTRFPGM
jgi:hypothetical protein